MDSRPLWECDIPFKQALAVAAVQKRRFDAEIHQLQQKCTALQQQIDALQHENAKSNNSASNIEHLLASIFSADNNTATTAATASPEDFLPSHLEALSQSAHLWKNAAEILLSHTHHPFLCQLLEYNTRRRALTTEDEQSKQTSSTPFLGGVTTPIHALIQLLSDIIITSGSTTATTLKNIDVGAATAAAASCLSELCLRPSQCLAVDDFSALQEFISHVIDAACDGSSAETLPSDMNNQEKEIEKEEGEKEGEDSTTAIAKKLLEMFQRSAGTGYMVLGCAADALLHLIQQLRALVTGQPSLISPPPFTSSSLTAVEEEKEEGEASSARYHHENEKNEKVLVCTSIAMAVVLQGCLRELPRWATEMVSSDDFLQSTAASIWEVSEVCKVVAPAHPEVAKQGQRCAALLVSALQQMAA